MGTASLSPGAKEDADLIRIVQYAIVKMDLIWMKLALNLLDCRNYQAGGSAQRQKNKKLFFFFLQRVS